MVTQILCYNQIIRKDLNNPLFKVYMTITLRSHSLKNGIEVNDITKLAFERFWQIYWMFVLF